MEVLLARIQFALTIGFHFLFPPISIGLAWILVIFETKGWRNNDESYIRIAKFFGKLLALTFAVGVATGIVMEFQFGTNWAEYSKFVGDIFGAPLAAEGVFAFFLESSFLGLYLFGRNRVSKGVHWFSGLMVAVGATISAFWIIVAGSWMQTPAGYTIQNGRAELTSFAEAVFNPSTVIRFLHTIDSAIIMGAFFVAGISAYLILKNKQSKLMKKSLKIAIIIGLVASVLELFPLGHEHAIQVAETQPAKFATIEGITETTNDASLLVVGIPTYDENGNRQIIGGIEIPGLMSALIPGDEPLKGMNEFNEEDLPPFALTFFSFHLMVGLGTFFIALMALATFKLKGGKLYKTNWLLKVLVWSTPLPLLAIELGWIAAEVGRQPWIVYNVMRTEDAVSTIVSSGEIIFSIVMFSLIYLLLGGAYLFFLIKEVKKGPELNPKEVSV
ncbi:MAG: cytochrome ubiquinol oxidase subunit I [Candidatus Marinimicrobia bacterium]|nr:cytochrome ubiquinol oxidase subunit I [Candidatus Neomarinimicrobiota bacterium]MBL7022525.1 cytochrome ubiquinol oxidase subunit I [Candidatus Neomarinimicrobiota bacterium]MBL7108620.1 cytochrome ubiquinol oxidase subunit I [Candidatus Neomarinimicrobiota bacterium]